MYLRGRGPGFIPQTFEWDPTYKAGFQALAYWRKHPDLHGYIVQTFAAGVDECQEIPLTVEDLKQIANACYERQLPHTEGLFFGQSSRIYDEDPQDEVSAKAFRDAANWLEAVPGRAVFYRASW